MRTQGPEFTCPYCGEPAEVDLDAGFFDSVSLDNSDEFIQDCSVCCRPWRVLVEVDADREPRVTLLRQNE
jgi:hypothetical protein